MTDIRLLRRFVLLIKSIDTTFLMANTTVKNYTLTSYYNDPNPAYIYLNQTRQCQATIQFALIAEICNCTDQIGITTLFQTPCDCTNTTQPYQPDNLGDRVNVTLSGGNNTQT